MHMKTAVVSMAVGQGHCEENFTQMCRFIEQAKAAQADLIVFPQNVISGYALGDLWLDQSFCERCDRYNAQIAALADTIAIVWGNVRYRGGRLFNTAFFAFDGQLELRVKGYSGELCNDARYFSCMEGSELIEYKGELIALNFHDELQLATLNITLDASMHSLLPRGASQIYVNAGGIWLDEQGVHLLDGRCFVSEHSRILHFSEHAPGCYLADAAVDETIVFADAHTRMEALLRQVEACFGRCSLPAQEQAAQRLAKRYGRPWLLEEGGVRFQTQTEDGQGALPSLFCSFTPEELVAAGVLESVDDCSIAQLFIACYAQTHSLRGVCHHALRDGLGSQRITELLKDLPAFVDALLACMETYYAQRFDYRMPESERYRLKEELLDYLQERNG